MIAGSVQDEKRNSVFALDKGRRKGARFLLWRTPEFRHTGTQPQQVQRGMGAFGEPDLISCGDMAKEHKVPSHIDVELALLALESAISGIQFIDDNDFTTAEFRDCLPAVLEQLNNATYYLTNLKKF